MTSGDPVSYALCLDDWPSVDDARPTDEGGTTARNGFSFQDHVAVSFLIEMLKNPALIKIHFETHDDIVLNWKNNNLNIAEFVQVKSGNIGSTWSIYELCRTRGTKSIFEASLERDRYRETSRFRIVTAENVKNELRVLTLERYCPARAPSDPRMRAISDHVAQTFPDASSKKGNTAGYWLEHCLWDVRYDLQSLSARNLASLLELSEREQRWMKPSRAKALLGELLQYVAAASSARWDPRPSAKIITRDWLRTWWEQSSAQLSSHAAHRAADTRELPERPPFFHRDIYLDVLNPDYHTIFGWNTVLSDEQQVFNLVEILTIAVFLCRDRCILPPGFVLQSQNVRRAIELTRPFFEATLVQWPMREVDPKDFWKKKIGKMIGARKDYPRMLDQDAAKQLYSFPGARDPNKPKVGITVAKRWLDAPDLPGVWDDMKRNLPANLVDDIRHVPSRLVENAKGVTLGGLAKHVRGVREHSGVLLRELAKSYNKVYLDALDVTVLSGVPNCGEDFGLGSGDTFYSVRALQAALQPLGLWPLHQVFSPEEIVDLRSTGGYGRFITAYIAVTALEPYEIRRHFAQAADAEAGSGVKLRPPAEVSLASDLLVRRVGRQPSKLVRDAADWMGQVAGRALR